MIRIILETERLILRAMTEGAFSGLDESFSAVNDFNFLSFRLAIHFRDNAAIATIPEIQKLIV